MTPMTLFIPTVGTVLELVEDWTFPLHEESRNHKFSKEFRLGYREWVRTWGGDVERADLVTLPAGTRLKVDRIYIRKGGGADVKEYDSVTFFCNSHLKPAQAKKLKLKKGRFWAKLPDCNRMVVIIPEETP